MKGIPGRMEKVISEPFNVVVDYASAQKQPQNDKKQVDDFIIKNPTYSDKISKMFEVPGVTDKDILDWLKANNIKIQ